MKVSFFLIAILLVDRARSVTSENRRRLKMEDRGATWSPRVVVLQNLGMTDRIRRHRSRGGLMDCIASDGQRAQVLVVCVITGWDGDILAHRPKRQHDSANPAMLAKRHERQSS